MMDDGITCSCLHDGQDRRAVNAAVETLRPPHVAGRAGRIARSALCAVAGASVMLIAGGPAVAVALLAVAGAVVGSAPTPAERVWAVRQRYLRGELNSRSGQCGSH